MWVAQHCYFDEPKDHITSGGLGTMGFGLPAGLGAQLGAPNRTVITVSGDGSIMMNIQELATLNRYDICLLYTSPSPRDQRGSRMPSSA